ncbi:hypothetical protein PtA15_8A199 [Puccinia triticina]|uniref:Uncharacterized protein n=1 Tax=Puccinia triticina TaxID=208348 RepID=A0ABY7CQI0_9BASI|nr:uncharacterized protein PtA15_8A199 [Puccinia triticina]WAQ87295.1 hypothetical protein PtA15_8A199 [Puccinia triticina]
MLLRKKWPRPINPKWVTFSNLDRSQPLHSDLPAILSVDGSNSGKSLRKARSVTGHLFQACDPPLQPSGREAGAVCCDVDLVRLNSPAFVNQHCRRQ